MLAVWLSGNALASINVVVLRRARLVLGWVTVVRGRVYHHDIDISSRYLTKLRRPTQPGYTSVGRHNEY